MLEAEIKKALANKGIFNSKSFLRPLFARIAKKAPAAFLIAAGLFFIFQPQVSAAPQIIDGAFTTDIPSSRKVFYHAGYGRT